MQAQHTQPASVSSSSWDSWCHCFGSGHEPCGFRGFQLSFNHRFFRNQTIFLSMAYGETRKQVFPETTNTNNKSPLQPVSNEPTWLWICLTLPATTSANGSHGDAEPSGQSQKVGLPHPVGGGFPSGRNYSSAFSRFNIVGFYVVFIQFSFYISSAFSTATSFYEHQRSQGPCNSVVQ